MFTAERAAEVSAFWEWFASNGSQVAHELDAATDRQLPPLLAELERRIRAFDPALVWEIGPHDQGLYLAISPAGDPERYHLTQDLVAAATLPRGWTAFAAKPPKDWNRSLEFAGRQINAANWAFYLEKSGEQQHVHFGTRYPVDLPPEQLKELGRIVIESDLGEAMLIEHVSEVTVELLDQWPDAVRGRHISELLNRLSKGQS